METPISSSLRVTLIIHMILAVVIGAALWIIPGRALTLVGWVPDQVALQPGVNVPGSTFVDGVITRILGAAILALGSASFLGWRARNRLQVSSIVQSELVFCIISEAGLIIGLFKLGRPIPIIGWVCVAVLAIFAIAWGLALRR